MKLGDLEIPTSVVEATKASIRAATHLTKADTGALATLMKLAVQVDYLIAHEGLNESGKFDNVTIPVYLKYSNDLGLTPAGRKSAVAKEEPTKPVGRLDGIKAGLKLV